MDAMQRSPAAVAARLASSVVQRQVRYVRPVTAGAAQGLVARVYEQVADEMRLVVPPSLLHSPAPDVLAAHWVLMREPLVAPGVDRRTKEAVAVAVSVANICPYCAETHTAGMYQLSTEHDAEAVAGDRAEDIKDPDLRAVTAWARSAHRADGPPLPPDLSTEARAELVGVLVAFHYVARMVNVFLPGFLLPPVAGPRTRRRLKQGVGRILGPALRTPRVAGRSLRLLPAAELAAPDRWARPAPCVAEAVARSYHTLEAAGRRSVSPPVRRLVERQLDRWRGEEMGLSPRWCEDLIVHLSIEDQAVGRLALLAALASHQVDAEVVAEFRRRRPDDAALVETVAWASFAAARLVGRRRLSDVCGPAVGGGFATGTAL
jgi:AhpD family alkylhydroperoxidase